MERERKRRIENFHRGFKTLVYRSPILWRRKGGRKGVARRTKRRGPPRSLGCSRSGVEHPTDGNVRRNSVQPRAQALPLLSAIFLSLPFRIRSPISIRLPPEPLSPSTLCIPRRVAERAIRQLFRISFRSRLRYARCSDRGGGERVSRLEFSPIRVFGQATVLFYDVVKADRIRFFLFFFFFLFYDRLPLRGSSMLVDNFFFFSEGYSLTNDGISRLPLACIDQLVI